MSANLPAIPTDHLPQNLPEGWAEYNALPAMPEADWDDLDDWEHRIGKALSQFDSYQRDAAEMEKTMRMIEARRGTLLGPAKHGGDRKSGEFQVSRVKLDRVDASAATVSRWRKIARHWDTVVWPALACTTKRRDCTQAAVLRLIKEHEQNDVSEPDAGADEPEPEHEYDLAAELERAHEQITTLESQVQALTADDKDATLAELTDKLARLHGRMKAVQREAGEAKKQAKWQQRMLRKLCDLLGVERFRDLASAIEALQ